MKIQPELCAKQTHTHAFSEPATTMTLVNVLYMPARLAARCLKESEKIHTRIASTPNWQTLASRLPDRAPKPPATQPSHTRMALTKNRAFFLRTRGHPTPINAAPHPNNRPEKTRTKTRLPRRYMDMQKTQTDVVAGAQTYMKIQPHTDTHASARMDFLPRPANTFLLPRQTKPAQYTNADDEGASYAKCERRTRAREKKHIHHRIVKSRV